MNVEDMIDDSLGSRVCRYSALGLLSDRKKTHV